MTVAAAVRPGSFWIALPDGWVGLDVTSPDAAASVHRLLDVAGRVNEAVRRHRGTVEQLLAQLRADATGAGIQFCACFFRVVDGLLPVQASLTISLHKLGENTIGALESAVTAEHTGSVSVVRLGDLDAVRVASRRRHTFPGTEQETTFVSRQFFLAVPGTADEVALLTFASPTTELEVELSDLFDSMARTFAFTAAR